MKYKKYYLVDIYACTLNRSNVVENHFALFV